MFEFNCGNSNDGIRMIRIQFAPGVTEYKAGTPFSRDGRFSNDGNAYGLLRQDIRLPVGGKVPVVVEGTVNTDELARHCGVALSEEAKAAMEGIAFVTDGDPIPSGGASSWNDLKDKPFGEETILKTVIQEQDVTIEANEENDHVFTILGGVDAFVSGDEYKVTFDGVEYLCVAKEIPNTPFITIGNQGLSESVANVLGVENTGEPFCFAYDGDLVVATKTGGTYSVKVEHFAEEVKVLDPKYLPNATLIYNVANATVNGEIPTKEQWIEWAKNLTPIMCIEAPGMYCHAGNADFVTQNGCGVYGLKLVYKGGNETVLVAELTTEEITEITDAWAAL